MLKIAVIGLGDISKIHIPVIQDNPNAELVAVCDIDETLKDTVSDATFYTDYLEMLEKEALDCVHICLPHYLHYAATKACVERGVHVFLEKPLARSAEEGMFLVDLEETYKDIKICVSFQNRLNETFEKLLEVVESGEYGKVTGLKGLVTWFRPKSYYDEKPWRGTMKQAGGGVVINQAIHTLDQMQLIGGEINTIRGSIDNLFDYGYEVEDTATANIQFQNGATGLFFATVTNATNSSVEFQVILEKGKLTIKDSILTKTNDKGEKERVIEDAKLPGAKFYYGASHSKLINHFYTCIENNSQDYIHTRDAQKSMEIISAIRRSSEIKKEIKMEVYQ
ncbi:lipopolysaccharide biosynthesis protein [Virgibacillus profundi]|uniref:Lipopolysaccharide biosynthesis protein n=1 Tax=Virgibacillus profundi TaxID=2024555 RepID=A0A2A2IF24_9BACI|nr:Gfo/Idh/MocA family oxidoreductase [Virgibacillus profundi]PAV30611.1 lipopolysaccharide biosynthesis protein [Virgibacillus profundi]PXY54783.1 gfo/Idh/MocA family oxidoreductase [Virgibacillus profundi]